MTGLIRKTSNSFSYDHATNSDIIKGMEDRMKAFKERKLAKLDSLKIHRSLSAQVQGETNYNQSRTQNLMTSFRPE